MFMYTINLLKSHSVNDSWTRNCATKLELLIFPLVKKKTKPKYKQHRPRKIFMSSFVKSDNFIYGDKSYWLGCTSYLIFFCNKKK